jgi:hypothetical protein
MIVQMMTATPTLEKQTQAVHRADRSAPSNPSRDGKGSVNPNPSRDCKGAVRRNPSRDCKGAVSKGKTGILFKQALRALAAALMAIALGPPTPARAGQGPDPALVAIDPRMDPSADIWPAEIRHVAVKGQLARLQQWLCAPGNPPPAAIAELFTPDATVRGADRIPAATQRDPVLGIAYDADSEAVSGTVQPFDVGLGQLRDRLIDCTGSACHLKTVRVHLESAEDFATEALFQLSATCGGQRVQWNADWRIRWSAGVESADAPRIAALVITNPRTVRAPRDRFRDVTRRIITDDTTWYPQLARGSEHWYGRIDALGQLNFMGHHGIAIGDVNGDGLDDVYVAMGEGLPNKLLVRQPDGTVRDEAASAGVDWLDGTAGVLLVDLDNDGDRDLLCAIGPVIVYCQNDGTGKFTPVRGLRAGTPAAFYGLAAADYDLDGDLDIYATRYVKVRYGVSAPVPYHDANNGPRNHLLRNDGAGGFTDVTLPVGLDVNNRRFSLAAVWTDYDHDGDPDLYVTNDFGRNNLYRNDGGKFKDVAASAGAEDQAAGMGASVLDFDLDGDLDLYVSNMFSSAGGRVAYQPRFAAGGSPDAVTAIQRHSVGNSLLANNGDGTFSDVSDALGVRMGRWAWGARGIDLNNDGFDDLVVPNGFLTGDRMDDL